MKHARQVLQEAECSLRAHVRMCRRKSDECCTLIGNPTDYAQLGELRVGLAALDIYDDMLAAIIRIAELDNDTDDFRLNRQQTADIARSILTKIGMDEDDASEKLKEVGQPT